MGRTGFTLLSMMAFMAISMASPSDARADLIVVDAGMSSTTEELGSSQPQETSPHFYPDARELMMLVLFNSANEAVIGHQSTGGASAAGMGSNSSDRVPTPQAPLFSPCSIDNCDVVVRLVCESIVRTPQPPVFGIFHPPRAAC